MLTIHHLAKAQSERVPWVCEELGIPYDLKRYDRDPATRMSPAPLKALHPMGSAPVITNGDVPLAESGAIVQYLDSKYGKGRLSLRADDPSFADYLYWFHFANATLVPTVAANIMASMIAGQGNGAAVIGIMKAREDKAFALVEDRLGKAAFFSGPAFTAADIMMFYPLTTMRHMTKRDFSHSPNTRAYLRRIGDRPAYQRAMAAAEPNMQPILE
jgi:glutathione S-transferase